MKKKTIALIAHDGKKDEMLDFALEHKSTLERYHLLATGTTGRILKETLGLDIEAVLSGPVGGDVQIAARVVGKEISAVVFFVDPLDKHPHDPDIQTLLRSCNVHDIPLATNPSTARLIIRGEL